MTRTLSQDEVNYIQAPTQA